MTRPRRTRLDNPTAENQSDVIGGLNRGENDDLFRRTAHERYDTPRRYDQPASDDERMREEERRKKKP